MQDLLAKTPGVTLNKWDERVYPTTRGFSVDYYLFDGVPTFQQSANDIDLVVYDRVEVVKGANGLISGTGNPSMGMNFIRKHTNSKKFKGNLNVSADSQDNYSAIADIQTPIDNKANIKARLAAKHQEQKSYMDKYKKENDIFYGTIDMDLTDTTFVSLGASYEDLQRDGIRWGGLPAFYTDGTRTNYSRKKTVSGNWTYWDIKTKSYFTDIKQYVYDGISLNLSLSQRDFDTNTALAYFNGKVDQSTGLGVGFPSRYSSSRSEKENNINLYTSIPFELGKLDHEVIIGAMYNKHKVSKDSWRSKNASSQEALDIHNIQSPWQMSVPWNSGLNTLNNTTQKGYYLATRLFNGKFKIYNWT